MRTLLTLAFLFFLPGIGSAQPEIRLSAGSKLIQLPSSKHIRVRQGAVRPADTPPIGLYAGIELKLQGKNERLPVFLGLKHGVILGTNLSADFSGIAERCVDDQPAGTAPVIAQARLESTNFWQLYGNVGLVKIPEWRQLSIQVGGGLTVFSRQRVHQAVSQINEETGRAEVPDCGFGFRAWENSALEAVPYTGERLSLGQPMLRTASAYGEVLVSIQAGNELEMSISGQFGLSNLIDESLYNDRLVGAKWFALGIGVHGRIF